MSERGMTTAEARRYVVELRAHLDAGGRSSRRMLHASLDVVAGLADALDAARRELRRHQEIAERHDALVQDWNDLVAGLRELGIVVAQPAHAAGWVWNYRGQSGEEAAVPVAFLAALRAAGLATEEEALAKLNQLAEQVSAGANEWLREGGADGAEKGP